MNKRSIVSGESVTEILVAISVLAIMLTSTFSLLNRAVSSNVNVSKRVMALNIAREGVEGVRSIRDTNWLKYSGAIRAKWLCHEKFDRLNGTFTPCTSAPFTTLASGDYLLDFTDSNARPRYYLYRIPDLPTLPEITDQLYLDTQGRYTHTPDDGAGNDYTETDFSRTVELEVIRTPNCGANPCDDPTQMRVISSVSWDELTGGKAVTLETVLFDFLNRTEY